MKTKFSKILHIFTFKNELRDIPDYCSILEQTLQFFLWFIMFQIQNTLFFKKLCHICNICWERVGRKCFHLFFNSKCRL